MIASVFLLSDTAYLNPQVQAAVNLELSVRGWDIAYVSATTRPTSNEFFERTTHEYQTMFRRSKLSYYDLSDEFSDSDLLELLEFDAVHLSGGNVFDFCMSVERRGLGALLRRYIRADGLIIGVSAGAIILTPSLKIGHIAGDEPNGQTTVEGLGLVPLEFFPHYMKASDNLLVNYSNSASRPVYACPDTDGVLLKDGVLETFGQIMKFERGLQMTAAQFETIQLVA